MKTRFKLLTIGVAVTTTGCELTFPLNREGREVTAVAPNTQTMSPFEDAYIRARRRSAGVSDQPVFGLAFSGGGVRSATVNLGVLQGLEDADVLRHADYLSSVSGGSYIAGWYTSHLRTKNEYQRLSQVLGANSQEMRQFSTSRRDLLQMTSRPQSQAVDHLRNKAGLFGPENGDRNKNLAISGGWWLATLVPNTVLDLVHFQPLPGKFNVTHPFYAYRNLLEDTYLTGWDKVGGRFYDEGSGRDHASPSLSRDMNQTGSQTPYLICNGALGNSSFKIKDGDGKEVYHSDNHNFEFSRYRCGSPLIGWVPTEVFDRPVANVKRDGKGGITTEYLKGPLPFPSNRTAPFRLSSAVAASGAALDSAMIGGLKTRVAANSALGLVNANLRYQTSNFTQTCSEWYLRPVDRLREVTTDRYIRGASSNTLQISDGAHFDNLGVYSLLRRNVPVIVAIDATADKNYEYGDLRRLLQLIQQSGWAYEVNDHWQGVPGLFLRPDVKTMPLPAQLTATKLAPVNPIWKFRVRKLVEGKVKTCTVWYVKNSFRSSDLTGDHVKGLRAFRDNPGELTSEFPHVTTAKVLGWSQPQFDTYREMGRLLGRWVSEDLKRDGAIR